MASAPTSPEPTSPAPTSPMPTTPAPRTLAPTSPAPSSPAPTSTPPTSPSSTSPRPTSPPPTPPPPTSPPPTTPAPTIQETPSPAPTPLEATSSAPRSLPPASRAPTTAPTSPTPISPAPAPPSPSPRPSEPASPIAESPEPAPLASTSPAQSSPAPTPPTQESPEPATRAPTSPAPTSSAPSSPAPSSPAPSSPAPTFPETTPPSPTSPAQTSPAPTPPTHTSPTPPSPAPTTRAPKSPGQSAPAPTTLAPYSPEPISLPPPPASPTSPTPAPLAPTSPAPLLPAPSSPAPSSPAPTLPASTPMAPTLSAPVSPSPTSPAPAWVETPVAPTSPTPASPSPISPAPIDVVPKPGASSPEPTSLPTILATSTSRSSLSETVIGAVSAAATVALVFGVVVGVCLRKKRNERKHNNVQVGPFSHRKASDNAEEGNFHHHDSSSLMSGVAKEPAGLPSAGLPSFLRNSSDTAVVNAGSRAAASPSARTDPPQRRAEPTAADETKEVPIVDVPPVVTWAERVAVAPNNETTVDAVPHLPPVGIDVAAAVVEAARTLATRSFFPGVCEAATLVSILVNLVSDDHGCVADVESNVKRCRLVILILQRASMVLGKGDGVHGEMERMLIEDVQTAVGDMVELIKTYRSKRRFSQVIVSTMFRRRMEETEAVIDRAISDLKLGLHVHTEVNQEEDRRIMSKRWSNLNQFMHSRNEDEEDGRFHHQRWSAKLTAESVASARRLRRQRNLNQVEIPEDHVTISEELLGKGGFGSVYIADYNGRNAAAKVINVNVAICDISGRHDDDARTGESSDETNASRHRTSFLSELQAMIRLKSPYTVHVYGAITARKERLVLVMELLTGGDLRSFLRHTEERLPEARARQIIEDVCAGMAFLHSKNAVHGDLKSPNILLHGEGRAKIADFGTSRWAQHSDSTGLATYKTNSGHIVQMLSFAWAAPEVLDAKGSSYASDVYSFGIVAWEVLSMEVPWADEALPFDMYRRVVFKGDRPTIPADAPADIADIVRACWAGPPQERPTSSEIRSALRPRKEQG